MALKHLANVRGCHQLAAVVACVLKSLNNSAAVAGDFENYTNHGSCTFLSVDFYQHQVRASADDLFLGGDLRQICRAQSARLGDLPQ